MADYSFNVLYEPWIPVIGLDGSYKELGILPCLEQAHNLREIRDPAPIVEFGLYRLLVAFVLDALMSANNRPTDVLDLCDLITKGRFDMSVINSYVKSCGDVFDLFHPQHPFLQVKMEGAEIKPLAAMFPAVPSGTNTGLWHHEHEDEIAVSPKQSARLLTSIPPFMTAGGAGLSPSINKAPPVYLLPIGKNLFETIIINVPCHEEQFSGEEPAAWRNSRIPGEKRSHATVVEALTWRPRRIQLIPGDPVKQMRFEKGDSAEFDWIDSNVAYIYEKDKVVPIRMRENRPLWRDAGPLLFLSTDAHGSSRENKISYQRPLVVEQAFEIARDTGVVGIQVYAMRTDSKMKIFEWIRSCWWVPTAVGRCPRRGNLVYYELEHAESVAQDLRDCIKILYPPAKDATCSLADRCERAYWQHLESRFYPLLKAIAEADSQALDDKEFFPNIVKDWHDAIKSFAMEQFELAAKDMDTDGKALERQVIARKKLSGRIMEKEAGK